MTNTFHTRVLELDKVLALLAGQAGCEGSRTLCLELMPSAELEEVRRRLAYTSDAGSLSAKFGSPSLSGMPDCKAALTKANLGGRLSAGELLRVAALLTCLRRLVEWKRQSQGISTSLDPLFSLLAPEKSLEQSITEAIYSEDEIADTASAQLADIRRKIRQTGIRIRDQLDKLIKSATYSKYLQEQLITQRDGRFVVPVKAEHRSEIKGLVHDTSSSGATLFIEPMAVVEANNEIRLLQNEEQKEIDKILTALSARVGEVADSLQGSYELAVEIDFHFAKSRLGDTMRASLPELSEDGVVVLRKARHPLIDRKAIVPVDISLGQGWDTLIITGPNTGGKTVALKTLGLLCLMASCGLMLPCADGSRVSVFSHVLADIGDEQSIEQSLSTFSAHIRNIIGILQLADSHSLVLLDELGAGTDPVEGAALAVAIIEKLRSLGSKTAATTHYAEMKVYALTQPGVENAACEFNVETLSPTYRLLIGTPGRSNAFAIGSRLGLEDEVIERARELLSTESTRFEEVVSNLEQARQQLEQEREQLHSLRKEAEQLRRTAEAEKQALAGRLEKELTQAREEARGIVERTRSQADLLINELEQLRKQKDKEDFSKLAGAAAAGYRGSLGRLHETANPVSTPGNDEEYVLPRPLRPGDSVLIADIQTEGIVLSGPDAAGNYTVQAGIIKTKVGEKGLRLLDTSHKKTTVNRQSVKKTLASRAQREARVELDIRGYAADEGIIEVERFIDSAILSGLKNLTIIHGKGTGVLRAAVQARLRKMSAVRTFRPGVYGEGEAGVTVVELK